MQTLALGLANVRERPVSMNFSPMVRTKGPFLRRNLHHGLGLLEEFIF